MSGIQPELRDNKEMERFGDPLKLNRSSGAFRSPQNQSQRSWRSLAF
jgi:hypothetical protein